ncbi:MAG: hypothetical protein L6R42_007534 [Xanthoria sp. 1 TBL-2021]|nr:MAG: hypothetical protein L6R42_007534 [Xanthoria sp. 1 TBL-2021]
MFYDLNVPYTTNHAELQRTLAFVAELGYNTIALSVNLSGKLPTDLVRPYKHPNPSIPPSKKGPSTNSHPTPDLTHPLPPPLLHPPNPPHPHPLHPNPNRPVPKPPPHLPNHHLRPPRHPPHLRKNPPANLPLPPYNRHHLPRLHDPLSLLLPPKHPPSRHRKGYTVRNMLCAGDTGDGGSEEEFDF